MAASAAVSTIHVSRDPQSLSIVVNSLSMTLCKSFFGIRGRGLFGRSCGLGNRMWTGRHHLQMGIALAELGFNSGHDLGLQRVFGQIGVAVHTAGGDVGMLNQVHLPQAVIPAQCVALFPIR